MFYRKPKLSKELKQLQEIFTLPDPIISSNVISNMGRYENQVPRRQENWKPWPKSFQRFLHIHVFFNSYEHRETLGAQP